MRQQFYVFIHSIVSNNRPIGNNFLKYFQAPSNPYWALKLSDVQRDAYYHDRYKVLQHMNRISVSSHEWVNSLYPVWIFNIWCPLIFVLLMLIAVRFTDPWLSQCPRMLFFMVCHPLISSLLVIRHLYIYFYTFLFHRVRVQSEISNVLG